MDRVAVSEMKAEVFRALAHPVRVRLLEALGDGELSVGALQAALDGDASGISGHLSVLRKQSLVEARRDGTSVIYRVHDHRVLDVLESTRQMLSARLYDAQTLLRDLAGPGGSAEPTGDGAGA